MAECLRELRNTVRRYREFMFGEQEACERVVELMAPGKIEDLVRQGRTPIQIGEIGWKLLGEEGGIPMQPFFEIPPAGFKAEDMRRVFMTTGGVHAFENRLGFTRTGITYTLTPDQARQIEERVGAERQRLSESINKPV